jgi:signal transduction histidine kinase
MKEQETLASVGKLVSHLAHELTNPIDAIRRFVNLALDQVAQDSLAREYLVKAKRGIRRSIDVIRGLLELSNTNGKKRARKTNLHDVIDDAINSILQDSSFEKITIQKDYSLKPLMVEDLGLKTVLLNLFQNAHHAMNGEGAISVATKEEGKQITITVCDSGCGVSERVGAKIFDAFFTTKENGKGTGIGLAICREIVRKSGGEISFESRENEGTTFKIVLPSQT